MDSLAIQELYREAMYVFPEFVPIPIKNVIDSWVGENYLNILIGRGFKIKIVIDANIIISEIISYFKRGKSHLLRILDHTIIEAVAPKYIIEEINEHIDDIMKKTNKTANEIWNVLRTIYFSKIRLVPINQRGYIGFAKLIESLKKKDPDDMPYLILYLSDNADAILSRDNDLIELNGVFTFKNVGHLKRVLYEIERGNLALFITVDILPRLIIYLGRLIITAIFTVIKALYDFAVKAIEAIKSGLKKFVDWFSELTPFGKFSAIFIGIISAVSIYEHREWIKKNIIDPIKDFVSEIIEGIIQFFKRLINLLEDLVYISVELVMLMIKSIQNCIEIYKELNSKISRMEVF